MIRSGGCRHFIFSFFDDSLYLHIPTSVFNPLTKYFASRAAPSFGPLVCISGMSDHHDNIELQFTSYACLTCYAYAKKSCTDLLFENRKMFIQFNLFDIIEKKLQKLVA